MKNLNNYNVSELNTIECKETNGGFVPVIWAFFGIGVLIGLCWSLFED